MVRGEYPRPQFVRKDWLCLNGEWGFEIDHGDSGAVRGMKEAKLKDKITVPFCPESPLSGIGNLDFMNAVWYRREVDIPAGWAGKRILLHFQAADYDTTVWVNGKEVMRHRGGYTSFTCDLGCEVGSKATVVVRCRDLKGKMKPQGKQSTKYENWSCCYWRTTGIWQTVWMEPVSCVYMKRTRITPDVANRKFRLVQPISNNPRGYKVRAILKDAKGEVARAEVAADLDLMPQLDLTIPENRVMLWGAGEPNLYGLDVELLDASGKVVDKFESYAGLRSVSIDGTAVRINGKNVFQRLVLDQGFYPDGIYTAPTDEALKLDIQISLDAGFNGARLHQKVFEERFLYWADKMGYLCWGEFADWHYTDLNQRDCSFAAQWCESIERDYSHPSIVGWCPQNETDQQMEDLINELDDTTHAMYYATKLADPSRPCIDSSGYSHRVYGCEIYDSHDYTQDVEKFRTENAGLKDGKPYTNGIHGWGRTISLPYAGQPYFVSEFGGIWWNERLKEGEESWGYGDRPKTLEEWHARFKGLCDVLLDDPNMFGYCYTQLTDVFQEQNGIVYFDRTNKFDMKRLHKVQTRQAAIEKL